MMNAHSMRSKAYTHSSEALHASANSLIAVIDRPSSLGALRTALAGAGIAAEQVEVLAGGDGPRQLHADGASRAAPSVLRRWLRALGLGSEAELERGYAHEIGNGHLVVLVHNVPRAMAWQVSEVVAAHGGHGVRHFGRFTVALLAP